MLPETYPLPDLSFTHSLAAYIAPHLKQGDFLALEGELGTGKTEFARALLRVLGVKDDVPSPTFTLLQTYEIKGLFISHYDLYRLRSACELEELGWDEALSDTFCIVEWPEHAEGRVPYDRLVLRFVLKSSGERFCEIEKYGSWEKRL